MNVESLRGRQGAGREGGREGERGRESNDMTLRIVVHI